LRTAPRRQSNHLIAAPARRGDCDAGGEIVGAQLSQSAPSQARAATEFPLRPVMENSRPDRFAALSTSLFACFCTLAPYDQMLLVAWTSSWSSLIVPVAQCVNGETMRSIFRKDSVTELGDNLWRPAPGPGLAGRVKTATPRNRDQRFRSDILADQKRGVPSASVIHAVTSIQRVRLTIGHGRPQSHWLRMCPASARPRSRNGAHTGKRLAGKLHEPISFANSHRTGLV
jgi:hypothetical protein